MNRLFVAGIAGLAIALTAGFEVQQSHAGFGRDCAGARNDCGGRSGGLFSRLGSRCGGAEKASRCGGGLLDRLRARRQSNDCCGQPTPPACCGTPAPAPAPQPCCEPAPQPCCGGAVTYSTPGCANCDTTMDSGVIQESGSPSEAPPAPEADPGADAPEAPPAPSAEGEGELETGPEA